MSDQPTGQSGATSARAALAYIADIHYQAASRTNPDGDCAVCYRLERHRIVPEPFPCPTRRAIDDALAITEEATDAG